MMVDTSSISYYYIPGQRQAVLLVLDKCEDSPRESIPWHALSKAFELCKVIILDMCLLSSSSLMIVKTSAEDLEEQKPYCLSLKSLFLLRTFLLIIVSKSLLRMIERYYDRGEGSSAFLYTGHKLDTFHGL